MLKTTLNSCPNLLCPGIKIIQNKIKEYQSSSNKKLDANGNSTNDILPKRHANNFIDECLKLSIQENSFTEEELINESLTMLIGV